MSVLNIRRDVKDSFYRYKMPRLIAKVEGKGNGIKTVIPNMSDIAKSLSRPPTYTTKYFGCELGAQVKCDEKTDRYIVNGAHDAPKLQTLLDGFIAKFVLCGSCQNPETDLLITKGQHMLRDCKACGQRTDVDIRHKLCTYILKNPPTPATKKKGGKKSKNANGSNMSLPTPPGTSSAPNSDSDSADELTKRIEADARALPMASTSGKDDDGENWCEDTSPEAVAARMKDLQVEGALEKLMNADDAPAAENGVMGDSVNWDEDEDDNEDPVDELVGFILANPTASYDTLKDTAKAMKIKDEKVCLALGIALFVPTTPATLVKRAPGLIGPLTKFFAAAKAQKQFLGGLEVWLDSMEADQDKALAKVPMLLKACYDAEALDEKTLLAWGAKSSKKFVARKFDKLVKERAKPFLTWLAEAEEESDDDDAETGDDDASPADEDEDEDDDDE